MKKFIFMVMAMLGMAVGSNAQNYNNYVGSSKFSDNWSVTLQGGVVTPLNHFFKDGSTTPVIVIGADKYVNPWLGFGVEGRTSIGTGKRFNPHTAFDAENVSGYVKFNVRNIFNFNGTRRVFEPVVYTGLGWGHTNCSAFTDADMSDGHSTAKRNYLTYRTGAELNFNLGKNPTNRAWAIVVNPSVVWGNICNGRLNYNHANFEVTAGIRYTFKSSNGKRVQSVSPVPELLAEVNNLRAQVEDLKNRPTTEKVVEKVVAPVSTWTVAFSHDSDVLSATAKTTLDQVATDTPVVIDAYASREPKSNAAYNKTLSEKRAATVKTYLEGRGVTVKSATGHGMNDDFGRVAVVTIK